MHDLVAPFSWYLTLRWRTRMREHCFDLAAKNLLIELEGCLAASVEREIRIQLHRRVSFLKAVYGVIKHLLWRIWRPTLIAQRPVELCAPRGWVWVRLRAGNVPSPETRGWGVPVCRDPGFELAPGGTEAFVGSMVDRPRHRRGGQFTRLAAPHGGNWRGDRHADLEIKDVWVHPQVVREPWPGGSDALGGDGGHQFTVAGSPDIPNFRTRNRRANDGG